jgi:hypothetical protein
MRFKIQIQKYQNDFRLAERGWAPNYHDAQPSIASKHATKTKEL